MQTLNVGAGQTEQEYAAAEQQRRDDLRDESRSCANYFFWAAGLAAIGTGVLPLRLTFLVNIGTIDFLTFYGRSLGPLHPLLVMCAAGLWTFIIAGLGFAARRGYRWAFLAGIALYGVDMIALIITFSLWAFALHSFLVFKWYQGQKALKDLDE